MYLINSVAFFLFSFLNNAVWLRNLVKLISSKSDICFLSLGAFNYGLVCHILDQTFTSYNEQCVCLCSCMIFLQFRILEDKIVVGADFSF